MVEPELVERLQDHPLVEEVRRQGYQPFGRGPDGLFRLDFNEQRRCHFLRSDKLCGLHAASGPLAKPRTCRQFPFLLVETPAGVQVGLSFVCTAVQQNHGVGWAAHEEGLQALVDTGQYPRLGFGPIGLRPGRVLDWAGYQDWQTRARQQPSREMLAEIAGKPFEAHTIYPLAVYVLGYLEGTDVASMSAIVSQIAGQGRYFSRRLGAVVNTEQVRADADWGEYADELRRYLRHLVERHFLLLGPSLFARLAGLWALECVIHHYWKQLGDFWSALELVEAEFVVHVDGLESFYEQAEALLWE